MDVFLAHSGCANTLVIGNAFDPIPMAYRFESPRL
jgi:hypothetical protein